MRAPCPAASAVMALTLSTAAGVSKKAGDAWTTATRTEEGRVTGKLLWKAEPGIASWVRGQCRGRPIGPQPRTRRGSVLRYPPEYMSWATTSATIFNVAAVTLSGVSSGVCHHPFPGP